MTSPVLRRGGVLLHVGPHKTGTTAIQGALARNRRRLRRHGIVYPGSRLGHNLEAVAAIQRSMGWDRQRTDMAVWTGLADQVRAARGRVVLSSEVFCEASPESAQRIATDLNPERVQVVVTLRPLENLLPSNWQQYVKSGSPKRYDRWLEMVLEPQDPACRTPAFWVRNDHPAVIRRWADTVGIGNVMVVVVDPAKPRSLFDAFEDILKLKRGTFNADESGPTNRSLSGAEVELLRALNQRARKTIATADYFRFVKSGAVEALVEDRTPASDEPRLMTPAWALSKARDYSRSHVDEISDMGVAVIGDINDLVPTYPIPEATDVQRIDTVSTDLAADFMSALLGRGIELARSPNGLPIREDHGLVARVRRKVRATVTSWW